MKSFTKFAIALRSALPDLRACYAEQGLARMQIGIEINGPVAEGDLVVTFILIGDHPMGQDAVRGSNLDSCLKEFKRRRAWIKEQSNGP